MSGYGLPAAASAIAVASGQPDSEHRRRPSCTPGRTDTDEYADRRRSQHLRCSAVLYDAQPDDDRKLELCG